MALTPNTGGKLNPKPLNTLRSAPQQSGGAIPPNRSQNLGQHLQDNSNVKGAYGQWGQQQAASQSPNSSPRPPQSSPTSSLQGYSSLTDKIKNPGGIEQMFTPPVNPAPKPSPQQPAPTAPKKAQPQTQTPAPAPAQPIPASASQPAQPAVPPVKPPLPSQPTPPVAQKQNIPSPQPVQQQPGAQPPVQAPSQPQQQAVAPQPARRPVAPLPQQPAPQPRPQRPQAPQQKSEKKGFFGNTLLRRPQQRPSQATPQLPANVDKNSPEYLRALSPQDLRREVIQSEIEIQKKLVESEKSYREGVATLRDLIAPSAINITTSYMEVGTKFVRTMFVLIYPREISTGWLEGIVNADIPMDLSIFVYPRDSGEVLRELKSKVGKIQASLQINAEKGAARDPALETASRDVEGLRDAIQQGVEKYFRVGVYMTIYADSLDELNKSGQVVEGMLSQQRIMLKRAALQMDDGFNSTLPILKDDLAVFNNLNTSPLSAAFPFVSSELSSNSGILYGINRHNSSLIIFDRFELENANSVVFATSGAGKSYAVKLEILRSLMIGVSVIVIDPEQEYKVLADTLGGAYVNLSLNSSNRINPFDLPKPLPGENTGDILRTAVIDIMGLLQLMLGKLTPTETSIMERAVQEAYAKRDITPDSDFGNITPPTMGDLVDILNGIVGGESLAQRLYRYTEGTFAGIFNKPTNINIDNPFVVFNIRDLQEELRPIAMYILLKFVWNEIRTELKRRLLVIDEAWVMMQYEDSAKFLYGLAKRSRKYYLGMTTITQDVGDFLNSPYGKPIVTNAAMKLLLKQSTAAIDAVSDTFALTAGEKQVLLNSEVGQGIFFSGPRHVAVQIVAFPSEHRIITTNPKDILSLQDELAQPEEFNEDIDL